MKFEVYLDKLNDYHFNEIVELKDLTKFYFEEAIEDFNREIQWDGMWDYTGALNRLERDWKLLVFVPDNKVRGWYWLDFNNRETFNLWIHKDWTRRGWGERMHLAMNTLAKRYGLNYMHCFINDWNELSQRCIERAYWKQIYE